MNNDIRILFTDLGGTFRMTDEDPAVIHDAAVKIARMVGTSIDPDEFKLLIDQRYSEYRKWVLSCSREAPEEELWVKWLAFDYDHELLKKNAQELTYQYRRFKGERYVVPGGVETLDTLRQRGYKLGIISDLVGTKEIDEWLDRDGLRDYFAAVELSSVCLYRKPDTEIYFRACRSAGIPPEHCAFVGDNLNRDIVGAKRAGFGLAIAAGYPSASPLKLTEENMPDAIIRDFRDLTKIFVGCPKIDLSLVEPSREHA